MAFYWNCPKRWLVSICIVCSTSWTHSMLKLSPWIMHRLWKQMQAITTLGIFHNGISNSSIGSSTILWNLKSPSHHHLSTRLYEVPICFSSWQSFFFTFEWGVKPWLHWVGWVGCIFNQFVWQKCAFHYFLANVRFWNNIV